jgi:hypothetical protein
MRMRAVINENQFSKLVRGDILVLELNTGDIVEFSMSDIGWDRMYYQIERAIRDHEHDQDSAAAAGNQQDGQQDKNESPAS